MAGAAGGCALNTAEPIRARANASETQCHFRAPSTGISMQSSRQVQYTTSRDPAGVIYVSSLMNLSRTIREMYFVHIYDNSRWGAVPAVLLQTEQGETIYQTEDLPAWLATALGRL